MTSRAGIRELAPVSAVSQATRACELAALAEQFRTNAAMRVLFRAALTTGLNHLAPVLVDGARVLEIGCATGDLTAALSNGGLECTGLDINPRVLHDARARPSGGRRFVVGDMQSLPFPSSSFHAVISVSTLQYADWRRTIRECERVLTPGGRALFVENLWGSPFAVAYRIVRRTLYGYPPYLRPVGHLHWDDIQQFSAVFGSADFGVHNLLTPTLYPMYSLRRSPPEVAGSEPRSAVAARRIDGYLLERWPALTRLCWTISIMCTKHHHSLATTDERGAP